MIVVYEVTADNEFEEIGRTDGEDVPEALTTIYPEEVWREESEQWLVERLDGPRVIAEIPSEEKEKTVGKEWIPYQGPQGGEGWQNVQNPEDVRYQEDPPGEIEPGYEEQAEGWGDEEDGGADLNPEEWDAGEIAETVEEIPDSQWEETESFSDLSPGDYAILDHADADRRYPARVVDADEESMEFVTEGGLGDTTEIESGWMMGWELGEHAPAPEQGVEELPEQFEDKYDAENITPIEQLGDPSGWDGEFPFSPGQTLLGENWDWHVEDLWFDHGREPRMELSMSHANVKHTFGYVDDPTKLGDLDPGWYSQPEFPQEPDQKDFIGVVGEPESYEFRFDPSEEVLETHPNVDFEDAADQMAEAVGQERYENQAAIDFATQLFSEKPNAERGIYRDQLSYDAVLEIAEHGLEANGDSVNHDRDITEAEEIALNGVKQYLHRQAEDHPTLDGKLSLGFVSEELHDDFQSRMTRDTRAEISNVMGSWVDGWGSMVDEDTIPLYALADETYENDFYPTRDGVDPLLETAENLEERKEQVHRYRQKTIDAFRQQWGDTIPVFRGYNPDEHSKGQEAREALQSEDTPDQINIRNGVANSWSTDPTVAYQFSQWTNGTDAPGVVVRQELPVERVFGASDTAPDLMGKETEIIAGNPEEISTHDREDVFLPEEFDALEQAEWAMSVVDDETVEEGEKAEGETLTLDWELSSVGWMNEHAALEDVLLSKHWTSVETEVGSGLQHVETGETVRSKAGIPFSTTAADAGHTPLSATVCTPDALGKEWIPYHGPRGGTGWRNTVNENIRYVEDKPEPRETDPDELTEDAVEEADIQQSWGLIHTTADDLREGDPLTYNDGEYKWDLRVQAVGEDVVHAKSRETGKQVSIPIDDRGRPTVDDASFHKPQTVFIGHGIAGSESSWLPQKGTPTDLQLDAEAIRSAAATDGMGDTSHLEVFAARADDKGIEEGRVIDALRTGLGKHPTLHPDQAEDIYENGQRLLEIEESLTDKSTSKYTTDLSKEWIPYEGPQGGEGWQNVNDPDDIRYQENPPGPVAEGYEEQAQGWGEGNREPPEEVQGATVIHIPVEGAGQDILVPKNFEAGDIQNAAFEVSTGSGEHDMTLLDAIDGDFQDRNFDRDNEMDWVMATAEAIEDTNPDLVSEFNEKLHDQIRSEPLADFDVPFGMDGPDVHDALEETFGRFSDIVGVLEERVLFNDERDEDDAETWINAAEDWIEANGDREMADQFEEALDDYSAGNPFRDTRSEAEEAGIPEHIDPARAEHVVRLDETEADSGISSASMFIAEYEDGSRAFVTNTSYNREREMDFVDHESEVDAQRSMLGYKAFEAAGMQVPEHAHLEGEYWTVEEAEGVPAKRWRGDPSELDREQFYKLGAVGMLSGNWDLHAGNVFVTPDGDLVPVDLDLSGHMMTDYMRRDTAWGRLRRLADKLGLFSGRGGVAEMKYEIAQKTQELVENGVARKIKRTASEIDHEGLQMNVEENYFAARSGDLYDDDVKRKPVHPSDAYNDPNTVLEDIAEDIEGWGDD